MKNVSYRICILFLIVNAALILLSPVSIAQENKDKTLPKIKLREVIYFDWESEVKNIADRIPGGRLIKMRSNERDVYMLDATLEDLNYQVAEISFQRPVDASGNVTAHRWVSIPCNSIDELNSNFDSLIRLLSTYSKNIRNVGKTEHFDTVIKLIDNDGSGDFQIDIQKKDWVPELRINITRFKYLKHRIRH